MESKRSVESSVAGSASLLIEPVWNRNCELENFNRIPFSLLIEPVWNRNEINQVNNQIKRSLLIEPVWNRNFSIPHPTCKRIRPSNRTSMESKLGSVSHIERKFPSNRTSMESKRTSKIMSFGSFTSF